MPCVDGDSSDGPPEANSIARSGKQLWFSRVDCLIYHGHDCFYYIESQSFTQLVYLCTLGPIKTQRLEHELVAFEVRYNNSLVCKQQMLTFSSLLLVSAQLVNIPVFLQNDFAAKYW